jgi:DNA-binding MarR family transcriptional regulator
MAKNKMEKQVGYFLERTTRNVKLAFAKKFKALNIDLTPEQWVMLDKLSQENSLSQVELANASFKNAPTISRIIDVMEKKQLVKREKATDDRRSYKITLTTEGKKLVKKIRPHVSGLREKSWNQLSDKDYTEFIRIINQVFDNFSE